jgi:hypothetical protein
LQENTSQDSLDHGISYIRRSSKLTYDAEMFAHGSLRRNAAETITLPSSAVGAPTVWAKVLMDRWMKTWTHDVLVGSASALAHKILWAILVRFAKDGYPSRSSGILLYNEDENQTSLRTDGMYIKSKRGKK